MRILTRALRPLSLVMITLALISGHGGIATVFLLTYGLTLLQ